MPFLIAGGYTVPVAPSGVATKYTLVGPGGTRQFDGSMSWDERDEKRDWTIRTAPMLPSDADALVTALGSGPSIACSGDLFNNGGATVTCFRTMDGRTPVTVRGGHRVVLSFTLHEG